MRVDSGDPPVVLIRNESRYQMKVTAEARDGMSTIVDPECTMSGFGWLEYSDNKFVHVDVLNFEDVTSESSSRITPSHGINVEYPYSMPFMTFENENGMAVMLRIEVCL